MDKNTLLNIRELLDNEDYKFDERIRELKKTITTWIHPRPDLEVELKQVENIQEGLEKAIEIIQIEINKCK